ncbi:hypothetical protein H5410_038362 [Solanum commersonii]|uniref:Ion transport domain-containing protein n=1 Tax=Solanum commersonii TaxID=4109 RepID=A0A9J5YAH2_SOLCO|nr:hypothetical protein H5410_038362 [Solanum commersonii]
MFICTRTYTGDITVIQEHFISFEMSYKELTGTAWTYVYFVSFYLISVLWLLNLIVAFVLEAFQAEMDLEAAANCVDGDDKESSERRRNVGTKTRSQRVDFLLHHMLSSELTECSHDNP